MSEASQWPEWATAKITHLTRDEAREYLRSAQGFWRDFACAGLTLAELREVIEDRRRKGPGGRISVPAKSSTPRPKQAGGSAISADAVNEWLETLPQVPHG